MSYPEQSGNWNDPGASTQFSAGYGDPAYQPQPDPAYQPQPGPTYQPQPDPAHQMATQPYPGYPASPQPNPAYQTPLDPTYQTSGQPADGQGYPVPPYPAYGYPMVVSTPTNGMAIASLVVSLLGIVGLSCYGLGGYIGIVGAILGHVSRKQVRERGESGDGMALAGVIVGWIAGGIAVLATIALIIGIVYVIRTAPSSSY